MTTDNFLRKLTAILSADVVGYSRLMGEDEEETVRTLNKYKEIIFGLINRNNGRLVDSHGDNLLVEFASVVDAVKCAVQIQKDIYENNVGLPVNRKMEFRIGINIGDVIQDGERIFGDGINVAARIESLADPGGICISRTAYDQVKNKINIEYEYLGEYEVKNIDEPVRIYKVLIERDSSETQMREKPLEKASVKKIPYPFPDKSSIAVLPFVNLSSDPEQEYFVDGLSEEILNNLAQIPDLTVIARTSSFSFKGSNKTIQEIAGVLEVENILEGSVRKAGNILRITTQLVKGINGSRLWSKTYERELKDIFAVQEDIATSVAGELKVALGIDKSLKQLGHTDNLEAYELYLVANGQASKSEYGSAQKSIDTALALDPKFADAWTVKAAIHLANVIYLPANRVDKELDAALSSVKKAIEFEPNLASGYNIMGRYESARGNWIDAELNFRKALKLQPETFTDIEFLRAGTYQAVGYFKRSREILEEMRRNDPLNQGGRIYYIVTLGLLGDMQGIENENERCKALFGDVWEARSYGLAYHRLGIGDYVSRDEIEYSSPIFNAAREYLNSSKKGLDILHRLYKDEDNLSESDITDISILAAYFGDPEFAMDAMEKGVKINALGLFKIWYPTMKDVRQLPRFKEFVREIGLVDYWKKYGLPDICRPVGDDDFECD
jgi:adenylate cyclase